MTLVRMPISTALAFPGAPLETPNLTCAVVGCNRPATQPHIISWRAARPFSHVRFCADHHDGFHEFYDPIRDQGIVGLTSFSLHYMRWVDRAEAWARRTAECLNGPPPEPQLELQLSFADDICLQRFWNGA